MIFLNIEYINARDGSWHCLLDAGIDRLPVKLSQICKLLDARIVHNSALSENQLLDTERGKTMHLNGQYQIIVRDTDPLEVQRYTIAHEIGHIYLGKSIAEYEAERFAIGILAPACVLWALDIHTAIDIAKLCNISMVSARIRAQRMEVLYARNKFLLSPLERQVYNQFLDFIMQKRTNRK